MAAGGQNLPIASLQKHWFAQQFCGTLLWMYKADD